MADPVEANEYLILSGPFLRVKRCLDVLGALCGLIVCSPFMAAIAWRIKCQSPGPVFFRQIRIGRYGKPFSIYKFRTMINDAETLGARLTVEDDWRITPFGRFLRQSKLDELPQLINVLRGEMSLVGPRPLVREHIDNYAPPIRKIILSLPPGMTDPASLAYVNESEILREAGQDAESYYLQTIIPGKQKYSLDYVCNRTIWMDMQTILRTLQVLVVQYRRQRRAADRSLPFGPTSLEAASGTLDDHSSSRR